MSVYQSRYLSVCPSVALGSVCLHVYASDVVAEFVSMVIIAISLCDNSSVSSNVKLVCQAAGCLSLPEEH